MDHLNTMAIDEMLAASISHLLTKNKIPCVLWGNYLLTIYGVPSIVDSIDFLVPDELVTASVMALQNTGLAACKNPESCNAIVESRPSPPPTAHFHIDHDSDLTLSIYTKSSALWFIPSLELSHKSTFSSPDIILASDPRLPHPRPGRGHGAFQPGLFPVCIPSAHRLLESYIRLIAGAKESGGKYRHFWMAMTTYFEEYVDGDGLLDEEALDSHCRVFYSGLKSGEFPVKLLLEDLRASLASNMR